MSLEEFYNFVEEIGFKETSKNNWILGNQFVVGGKSIGISICKRGLIINLTVTEFKKLLISSKLLKKWIRYQPDDLSQEIINEVIKELGYTPKEIIKYLRDKKIAELIK
jgi:hypothetical protein